METPCHRPGIRQGQSQPVAVGNGLAPSQPVQQTETLPDDSALLDALFDMAEDEETVYKTLVENPAKLFGFSNSGQEA